MNVTNHLKRLTLTSIYLKLGTKLIEQNQVFNFSRLASNWGLPSQSLSTLLVRS